MILALRAALALAWKDVRHHAAALAAGAVLYVAMYVAMLANALNRSDDSLLSASTNAVYYLGPFLAGWVVRRLFVVEREEGSAAFLAALPVAPWTIWTVRAAMAHAVTAAIALPWVPITAILVLNREIVTLGWAIVVFVQATVVLAAWVALSVLMAQLGRRRSAWWIGLVFLLLTLDEATDGAAYTAWTWHAALAEPLTWTRQHVPWGALAITTGWGLVFTVAAFVLATARHGAVVDAAWRGSAATVRDAVLIVAGCLFVLDVAEPWIDAEGAMWAGARPVAGPVATVAAPGSATEAGAQTLAADWAAFDAWVGGLDAPRVIVVPSHPGGGPLPAGDGELALRIDDRATAVGAVWAAATGGRLDRDERLHWLRDGVPCAFLARDAGWAPAAARTRAATAPPAPDPARWPAYEAEVGPDTAAAVACVGVAAWIRAAGEDAVRAAVRDLAPPSGLASGHVPAAPPLRVTRADDVGVPTRLDWATDGPVPDGAALVWAALSPLRTLPEDVVRVPIAGVAGQVAVQVDPDRAVWVALERPGPDGRPVRSGATVVAP